MSDTNPSTDTPTPPNPNARGWRMEPSPDRNVIAARGPYDRPEVRLTFHTAAGEPPMDRPAFLPGAKPPSDPLGDEETQRLIDDQTRAVRDLPAVRKYLEWLRQVKAAEAKLADAERRTRAEETRRTVLENDPVPDLANALRAVEAARQAAMAEAEQARSDLDLIRGLGHRLHAEATERVTMAVEAAAADRAQEARAALVEALRTLEAATVPFLDRVADAHRLLMARQGIDKWGTLVTVDRVIGSPPAAPPTPLPPPPPPIPPSVRMATSVRHVSVAADPSPPTATGNVILFG